MKPVLTTLSLCMLLLLAACGASQGAAAQLPDVGRVPRVEVELATAAEGHVTQELELVGNLVARRRTTVVTEVDGVVRAIADGGQTLELELAGQRRVETLSLGLGQHVDEGDVLVQIDPRDYELALAAARAGLEAARKELAVLEAWQRPEEVRRLRALRDQAAARVSLAALELARVKELHGDAIVSQSELDQARSTHEIARAVLDGAEAALLVATSGPTVAELDRARARIAQAQAEVDVREDRLRRTTIRAPFRGVITERFVDVGERVTAMPRVEILEVMDLSLVFVEVGVPERHIHRVQPRDAVSVRMDGLVEPVPGTVVLVNDKIDRDSRTYRVRVAVDNDEGRFKAGQFVRVAFSLRSSAGRLVVPGRAVTYGGGQPQVFVYANDHVTLRDVRLGLRDAEHVEVVEGLAAGERIVIDDPAVLADGMVVDVRQASPRPPAEAAQ